MTYNAEYERDRYEQIKADPVKAAAYRERKRQERIRKQSETGYETERKRKWRAANRERVKLHRQAMSAVEHALKRGDIARPNTCSHCGCEGKVEAHHFLGHEEAHRLDIVWLCVMCHHAEHPHPKKKVVAVETKRDDETRAQVSKKE